MRPTRPTCTYAELHDAIEQLLDGLGFSESGYILVTSSTDGMLSIHTTLRDQPQKGISNIIVDSNEDEDYEEDEEE